MTAGLDVDLVDLAGLDLTAERSVCEQKPDSQRVGGQQDSRQGQQPFSWVSLHSIVSPTKY